MKNIRIACEHCQGSGRRELTDIEHNTRAAVTSSWSTTDEIRKRLARVQGYDTALTALCNRLNALLVRGLVERRPMTGKRYQWRYAIGRDIRGEAIAVEVWGRTMRGER